MNQTSPHHRDQSLQYTDNYTTDAINALYAIPADLPRDEWVKVGMAYKAADGDYDTSGTGQAAAKAASDAILGKYSIAPFLPHEGGSDFNDRWCLDNSDIRHGR